MWVLPTEEEISESFNIKYLVNGLHSIHQISATTMTLLSLVVSEIKGAALKRTVLHLPIGVFLDAPSNGV